MSILWRDPRSVRRAVVVLAVATTLAACNGSGSNERPAGRPTGESTTGGPSRPLVEPDRAAMPQVPLRYMYARGDHSEGVLVGAGGTTATGRVASAYVPTRTGAVFASGDHVYDLKDGGTAVAIGPVREESVFLQVDPTLRYVAWEVRRPDGRHARVLVHDVVTHRRVLDRVLVWHDRSTPVRTTTFGAARLRLVHLPGGDFWTFASVSGHTLVTPGGQVVDRRSHRVEGPRVSRGVWSPGLRYRVADPRGRHPWRVIEPMTGGDVTPEALVGPGQRGARLTGWLGNTTFGVLASSGTWRRSSVVASVCRVAGRCRVVWRLRLGADDSGLQSSNEIG